MRKDWEENGWAGCTDTEGERKNRFPIRHRIFVCMPFSSPLGTTVITAVFSCSSEDRKPRVHWSYPEDPHNWVLCPDQPPPGPLTRSPDRRICTAHRWSGASVAARTVHRPGASWISAGAGPSVTSLTWGSASPKAEIRPCLTHLGLWIFHLGENVPSCFPGRGPASLAATGKAGLLHWSLLDAQALHFTLKNKDASDLWWCWCVFPSSTGVSHGQIHTQCTSPCERHKPLPSLSSDHLIQICRQSVP